jgi:methionine-rich copper-binding protein CopC
MMTLSSIRFAPASNHVPSLRAEGQAELAAQALRMMQRRRSVAHASTSATQRCLAMAALALMPACAPAHAIIVVAQPAMNSVVAPGEIMIRLEFNSRIDSERSGLVLLRPDGTQAAVTLTPGVPPGVLAGRTQVKQNGTWKLGWQVLSLDGHITRGEVDFSVRDAADSR